MNSKSTLLWIAACICLLLQSCTAENTNQEDGGENTESDPQLTPFPGPCLTLFDYDMDGEINAYWRHTYNTEGNKILREYFEESDIVFETLTAVRKYTYQNGLLVKEFQDIDADSVIDILDKLLFYYYDNNNNLIEEKEADTEDGEQYLERKHYYENGFKTRLDKYNRADQQEPESYTFYFYNKDDLLDYFEVYDDLEDDAPGGIVHYYYGEHNRLIQIEKDGGADGTVETSEKYTYNDLGLVETWSVISGTDGELHHKYTYKYDTDGNLLEELHDTDGDEDTDWRAEYTYDCWDE